MDLTKRVRAVISQHTRGIIVLNDATINQIIELVRTECRVDKVIVRKEKFDEHNNYKPQYQFEMEKAKAQEIIQKTKNAPQYRRFYRFIIDELNFTTYTVNNNLFQP